MPIPTELFSTITARLAPGGRLGTATDAIVIWRILFKKLAPLIGPYSMELLFARSLAAHENAFPWLPQNLPGVTHPLIEHFERSMDARAPEDIVAVNRLLLASFTSGLADLIGQGLTTRLLQAAFPGDASNNKNIEE